MKKSSKALCTALLLGSLIGVGTASAFVIKNAITKSTGSMSNEDVVYMHWGATPTIAAINGLTDLAPVYTTVEIAKPKTNLASIIETFTVSLTADAEKSLEGVSVAIASQDWASSQEVEAVATATVNASATVEYALTAFTENTVKAYLKVSVTSQAYAKYVANELVMGGKMTLSLGVK